MEKDLKLPAPAYWQAGTGGAFGALSGQTSNGKPKEEQVIG
jgi:hypothetical protein